MNEPKNFSQIYSTAQKRWIDLARLSYKFYCAYTHKGFWKTARHLELICNKLEQVEQGKIKKLMIFMPPRHGKSMSVTETFPSWFIGRNPSRRVIEVSYGSDLAQKFGRANRQKLEEYGKKVFNIEISSVNASSTNWGIQGQRGGMISSGVGGSITGEGADLLIIDDPIKNREEADSITYREKLWNEWQNTLLTRLHLNAATIIILTRWHEDDLAGRLLLQEANEWDILSLPAEAEDDDILGRQEGEPLWPEHGFGNDWLAEKKRAVGSRTFTSLYQQRPSPDEGSLFNRNWWKFYKILPSKFDEIIQSWDCTFKDGANNDYVVGQVWGRVGADKYLIDQVRDKLNIVGTMSAVRSLSAKYPLSNLKLIEDKANGPAVIEMLKREISGIVPVNPEGGKTVRAQAVSPEIEAGNIHLPDPSICNWVHDFIEECSVFPNGKHDDQVDSMTQALNRLNKPNYNTLDAFMDFMKNQEVNP